MRLRSISRTAGRRPDKGSTPISARMLLGALRWLAGRPLASAKSSSRLNVTLSSEAASGVQAARRWRKSASCAGVRKSTRGQALFSETRERFNDWLGLAAHYCWQVVGGRCTGERSEHHHVHSVDAGIGAGGDLHGSRGLFDLEIHQAVAQPGVDGFGLGAGGRTRHRVDIAIRKPHHLELELGFETPGLFRFGVARSSKPAHAASWSASARINAA